MSDRAAPKARACWLAGLTNSKDINLAFPSGTGMSMSNSPETEREEVAMGPVEPVIWVMPAPVTE
jgi:hypothetical protein